MLLFFALSGLPGNTFFSDMPALAGDYPFIGPANWGGTGLMEIPTARVMKEDSFRVGAAQVYPYRYYYVLSVPCRGSRWMAA